VYNYDRNIVIAAFRAEHPDQLDPKEQTLRDFDVALFRRYDAELRKQAPDKGIPLDVFSRSALVFFALQSTGKAVSTQVSHACKFFDSVRPQPFVSTIVATPSANPAGPGDDDP
jgi:hypothetical protein